MSIALHHTRRTTSVPPRKHRCRDRRGSPQINPSGPDAPSFDGPEKTSDEIFEEDIFEQGEGAHGKQNPSQDQVDDLVDVLSEVLLQPPYDIPPPAYLELNLVVGSILKEKYSESRTAGRIEAAQIYGRLSGSTAEDVDPDDGGLGITNIADVPSALVSQTEKYKATAYRIGPKTTEALNAFEQFDGSAGQVAKATAHVCSTGDVGPLEFLFSPTGQAPGTGQGADRRAIEVKTSETSSLFASVPQPRLSTSTGDLSGKIDAAFCSTRVPAVHGGGGIVGATSGESEGTSQKNPRDRQELDALSEETIRYLIDRDPLGTVPRLATSNELRDMCVRWRPVLGKSRSLMAAHQHILFSGMRDEDWTYREDCTGVVFPSGVVLGGFGYKSRQHLYGDVGANTGQLFDIYRREVASLNLTDWHGRKGKGRVVKSHGIPDRIVHRAKEAKLSPGKKERWFISGKKTRDDGNDIADLRDERLNRASVQNPFIEPPETTYRMQAYLNGLRQQRFSNGAYGVFKADKLEQARHKARSEGEGEKGRDRGLKKLFWIGTYPQPIYLACDRFPRLKADHYNQAMNLPTPIRRSVYTARDREMDLSKAHLASYVPVARREGLSVPVLERYLEANLNDDEELLKEGDLWTELASTIRCPALSNPKALRDAVKRSYSIVYGQEKQDLPYTILKEYGRLTGHFHDTTAPVKPLLKHPLMEEILGTRKELKSIMNERGDLEDANGRFIPLSEWNATKDRENRWRGVLAYVNASYEQKLMGAAFEEAQKELERDGNTRFWIWLYQGDGFTMRVRSDASATRQIERLQDAVGDEVGELDVPTELEVDYAG